MAAEKGKVYLVMGSDTAIWEGLGITQYDGRYFKSGLYSDPSRWGYGVMDSTFRNSMKDSYGTTMKMTWWMMAGNVFHLSNNCNIPIRNSITLYLMKKYHLDVLNGYDDQLTLHYHNYYWSDPNGDGDYNYNQGLDFRTNQADYEECLSKFLIEDDVFPISFRSGWHYMDNYWQAYQERFIPFDMSNAYPHKGGDYEEPTNNIIDWSESPSTFVPYHPNAENYQIEGDLKQWRLRSIMFGVNNYIPEQLEIMFQEAANGNDQMCCFWSHLPQDDFLPAMQYLHEQADTLSKQYGVEFMYAKDVEAMRNWINPEDTIAPVLTVNEILDGDEIRFEMSTDGPIFQTAEPFITIKTKYETYERLDCSITGENQWETIKGIPADELAKVSIAVCDTVGNQAKAHLDYMPDDLFMDDQDDAFVEGSGNWEDYVGNRELWNLNSRVLSGTGSVVITPNIEESLIYSVLFHGPGSTTDSARVIVNNSSITDTVVFNSRLLGSDKWQHVGFFYLEAGIGNNITFENLDANLNMGFDVVRITPLVADKNFVMETDVITFGDISVSDTSTYLLKLSNMGKEELNITNFSLFGSKIYFDETFPITLEPMEEIVISLKFYTDYFCEYNDVLTIETDDPRNSLKYIPIFANASTYFRLVDNQDAVGYSEHGSGWFTSVATAWLATSRCTYIHSDGSYADFTKKLKFSGVYDIQFIIPKTVNAHNHADYIILIDGVPQDTVVIDQNINSGHFVSIGEFDLPKDVEVVLRIQDNGGNTNSGSVLRADAVKFILIEEKFVSSIDNAGIPKKFKLYQNYPNPFNPSTQIYFALPQQSNVIIDFFDLQGRIVDKEIKRDFEAGYHYITWSPQGLSSGIYFYRVRSNAGVAVNKCTFVK
jgi:hypothetical protein